MKGIFITGTDTGVGKTFVAAGLLRAFREMGISACPMKPVETGCCLRGGRLIPHDARRLIDVSGVGEALDMINPYRFRQPLAPAIAAEIEGVRIQKRRILSIYSYLQNKYDVVIVEGAGGIMVPVYKEYLYLELIRDLGLPVLIISRPVLGTINHTLLTIEAAKNRNVRVAGVVFNYAVRTRMGVAEKTSPEIIKRISSIPVTGIIPYINRQDILKPSVRRLFIQMAESLLKHLRT